MPLSEPDHATRLAREVAATSLSIFRAVALPPRYFAVGNPPGADLLFKRTDDSRSVVLLVEAGVRYLGDDAGLRDAFAHAPVNGWRPLAVIRDTRAEAVLRYADALLGLDGPAPRRPAIEREILMRVEEAASGEARTGEDERRFGRDLVEAAREGRLAAPLFREAEMAALLRIASKAGKNAACLVGPPGVGKTAVVEGVAVRIAEGRVPAPLARARILEVNLSLLGAGAYGNEFEGRVKELLELARRDPDVILFLDELHTIRAPGGDASQMVKSDLGRGRIRCIGATTHTEFRAIEADPALARRFQVVPVVEPTPAQTIEILRAACPRLERHHRVAVPPELVPEVVALAVRHVPDRRLPDKALDLLDEACALARINADAPTPPSPHIGRRSP